MVLQVYAIHYTGDKDCLLKLSIEPSPEEPTNTGRDEWEGPGKDAYPQDVIPPLERDIGDVYDTEEMHQKHLQWDQCVRDSAWENLTAEIIQAELGVQAWSIVEYNRRKHVTKKPDSAQTWARLVKGLLNRKVRLMFQALPPHIEMRNQLDITCKSELRAEVYTQTRNEFCSSMDIFPRQEGQVVPPDSELALGRPDILTFSIEYCAFGSRLRDDDDSETSEDASDSEDSAPTASSPKTPPVVGDNDPDIKAEPTPPRPARTSDEAVRLETLEKK